MSDWVTCCDLQKIGAPPCCNRCHEDEFEGGPDCDFGPEETRGCCCVVGKWASEHATEVFIALAARRTASGGKTPCKGCQDGRSSDQLHTPGCGHRETRRGCGGPPLCYDQNCQKPDGHS